MSTLHLEISTPDEQFLSAEAEAVTMRSRTGYLTVLPGHMPMLVAFQPGEIRVKLDGVWKSLLSMEGFAEVMGNEVEIFTRFAAWESEAEEHRSEKEKREELERIRTQKSIFEHRHTKIELARKMTGVVKKNRNM